MVVLTGRAQLQGLLEVLGKQEAISVPWSQDHPIGRAEEGDSICRQNGDVTHALSEGLGWSLVCPDSPARARGPLMNTATSQFGLMPAETRSWGLGCLGLQLLNLAGWAPGLNGEKRVLPHGLRQKRLRPLEGTLGGQSGWE